MSYNTPFFYNPDRDDNYISDQEHEFRCVKAYKHVGDADDLAQWRAKWLPVCRNCERQTFCYVSHQMQLAKPKAVI